MGIRAFCAAAAAIGVATAAAPASAALVEFTSNSGAYSVFYDPALQSEPFTLDSTGDFLRMHVNVGGVGIDDPTNQFNETVFDTLLRLRFVPNPGHAFSSLDIADGVVSFHHAFIGGEVFDQTTTITPLDGGASFDLTGPRLSNIPPFGQGGGGAINAGIDLGSFAAPPGGFDMDMHQQVAVFNTSSFAFSSIDFDFRTTDAAISAPAAAGVPEPASWAIVIVGFGGLGALMRRRRGFAAV